MTLVVALILSIYNESESLSFLVEGGICDQSSANRLHNLGSACSITAPMAYTIGFLVMIPIWWWDGWYLLHCPGVDTDNLLPSSLPEAAKNPCSQLLTQLLSHQVFTMLLMYFVPWNNRTHCSDTYFTNGFYYFCLGTNNSATVRSHCRYAFPWV